MTFPDDPRAAPEDDDDPRLPRWPPEWVEDHVLATEEVVAAAEGVELRSALRGDDRLLMSVTWPGGRRYLLVDAMGADPARALRAGEVSQDAQTARLIDGLWSRALTVAKQVMDGEVSLGAATQPDAPPKRRRPWRRGEG